MKVFYWLVIGMFMTSCTGVKNWTESNVQIQEGIHDIAIVNEQIAIAYSYGTGNIYKTQNGGKNWAHICALDSIYFEQAQFFDEYNGWIVGSPNKIFATQDGGINWIDKSLESEFDKALIYGMWFEDKNNGFVSAIERRKEGFETILFQTQNGGSSWNAINRFNEMILHLESLDGILYATGNNVILKNVDKEDWGVVFRDTTKTVGQIRDIESNGGDNIFASSFNGFIVELNHEKTKQRKISQNRIRSLVSTKNGNWFAVGDANKESGNFLISNDNGHTWKIFPKEFGDIHRMKKSKKKLWLVGKDGLIMTRKI